MEGTQGEEVEGGTPASKEASDAPATKLAALTTPLPAFGEVLEPVTITPEMRKSLLSNLSLSGERIAAAMALEYCARAVALGRAATEATLASKIRKVVIRDGAKSAAKAAGPSKKTPPASTPDANEARLASIEKALKGLSSRLPAGKNEPSLPISFTNLSIRKRQCPEGEGDQAAKRRRKTLPETEGQWRKDPGEGDAFFEGEREWEREKEEGMRALKRCNFKSLFNGENVPDTVLKVPFESLVEFFRDHMPPAECFIAPTPVFWSPGVVNVPESIARMLSFNLKFILHCDPNPARIKKGFEEFKRSCPNQMYFFGKERDPLLTPTILKKLYLPSRWDIDYDD